MNTEQLKQMIDVIAEAQAAVAASGSGPIGALTRSERSNATFKVYMSDGHVDVDAFNLFPEATAALVGAGFEVWVTSVGVSIGARRED